MLRKLMKTLKIERTDPQNCDVSVNCIGTDDTMKSGWCGEVSISMEREKEVESLRIVKSELKDSHTFCSERDEGCSQQWFLRKQANTVQKIVTGAAVTVDVVETSSMTNNKKGRPTKVDKVKRDAVRQRVDAVRQRDTTTSHHYNETCPRAKLNHVPI